MTQEAGRGRHGSGRDRFRRLGLDRGGGVEHKDRPPAPLLIEALVSGPDPQQLGPVALQLGLGGRPRPVGSDLAAELGPGRGWARRLRGQGLGRSPCGVTLHKMTRSPSWRWKTGVVCWLPVRRPMVVSSTIGPRGWPGVTSRPPVRRYSCRSRGEIRCLMVQTPAGVPPNQLRSRDVAPIPVAYSAGRLTLPAAACSDRCRPNRAERPDGHGRVGTPKSLPPCRQAEVARQGRGEDSSLIGQTSGGGSRVILGGGWLRRKRRDGSSDRVGPQLSCLAGEPSGVRPGCGAVRAAVRFVSSTHTRGLVPTSDVNWLTDCDPRLHRLVNIRRLDRAIDAWLTDQKLPPMPRPPAGGPVDGRPFWGITSP
jgi:hypothetical protein